jgi:hypothetical protein
MMIVHENPNVKIEYFQSKKLLIQTWKGNSTSIIFKEAIDLTARFIETNSVKTIISDTLEQNIVNPEDTKYAISVLPLLFQSGVKAMAFVLPKNVFVKMPVDTFEREKEEVRIQKFCSIVEATSWCDNIK